MREWILGNSWVYNWIRPFFLGGFDFSACYRWLEVGSEDVVLDIGCGFGQSLRHLEDFAGYHGFDISERAIAQCRSQYGTDSRLSFHQRILTLADLEQIRPTKVLMMGILHHLSADQARQLLGWLGQQPQLVRAVTQDPVYRPGAWFNNLMCWLDRGRYVLKETGYDDLVRGSGLEVGHRIRCSSGSGLTHYLCLGLTPQHFT